MNPKAQAKRFSELLRVIILGLGNDVPKTKAEYTQYADWLSLPPERRLIGKNEAQLIDLYKTWRTEAGLGFERDVYLQQEPGDRQTAQLPPLTYSVLVHNLRSAFNVGSVFRSVDCFGLEAVHLSGYTPNPGHTTLKSAARGAETWVPYKRWESPEACIEDHLARGYEIIALETGENIPAISAVKWAPRGLILLGNEELGIAPELMQKATQYVTIPMVGRKASMNVAGAFSILAYSLRNFFTP